MAHYKLYEAASILAQTLALAGATGASVAVADGTGPAAGYMVSLVGAEQVKALRPDKADIVEWIEDAAKPLVAAAQQLGHKPYLGVWLDDATGRWYLDVSINVGDLSQALTIGARGHQKAVFDVARGEAIAVPVNA
jgi:hypothetical protein